jgi:hypothetical protein
MKTTLRDILPKIEAEWLLPAWLLIAILGAAIAETLTLGMGVQKSHHIVTGWIIGLIIASVQAIGSMMWARASHHNARRYVRMKWVGSEKKGTRRKIEDKKNSEPKLPLMLPALASVLAGIVSASAGIALYAAGNKIKMLDVILAVAAPAGSIGAAVLNGAFVESENALSEWAVKNGYNRAASGDNRSSKKRDRATSGDDRSSKRRDRATSGDDRSSKKRDRETSGDDRSSKKRDRVTSGDDRSSKRRDRATSGDDRSSNGHNRVTSGDDRSSKKRDRAASGDDRSSKKRDRATSGDDRAMTGDERSGNGHTRSFEDFKRATAEGVITPDEMSGKDVAQWAGVSASTGRRWKRELAPESNKRKLNFKERGDE